MLENPQKEAFWSSYYEQNHTPWQLPVPCPPIFKLLDQQRDPGSSAKLNLKPGSVIILGCGTGLEPLEFARRGFQVTGVDLSALAVERAKAKAQTAKTSVDYIHSDIFALGEFFNGRFDYVFEQTCFCAIDPGRRPDYVELVTRLLKPRGVHFGVFFDVNVESPPPFGVTEDEIHERFAPHFVFDSFAKSTESFAQRADKEWLFCFRKRS